MPRIHFVFDENEVRFEAVRAQGAGGQNVNKVSNAVVLRFDIEFGRVTPEDPRD